MGAFGMIGRMGGVAAALAMAATAAGQEAGAGPEAKPAQTAPAAKPAEPAVKVTLLKPGEGEVRELRYAPEVGAVREDATRFDMTITPIWGGEARAMPPIPTSVVKVRTTVAGVDDEGRFDVWFEVVDTAIEDTPGVSDAMRQGRTYELEGLIGTMTTLRVSDRGLPSSASVTGPGASSALVRRVGLGTERSIVAFPEEAVAPGASWKVERTLDAGQYTIDEATTYTLSSVEGDELVLDMFSVRSAASQRINGQVELASLAGTVSGRVTVKLSSLAPSSMRTSLASESTTVVVNGPGMQTETPMRLRVESAVNAPLKQAGPPAEE